MKANLSHRECLFLKEREPCGPSQLCSEGLASSGARAWAGRTCLLDRGGLREGGGCPSPSLAGGEAGLGRGLAGNVSHPELGHGCSQSQGAVQQSGDEREVEDRH